MHINQGMGLGELWRAFECDEEYWHVKRPAIVVSFATLLQMFGSGPVEIRGQSRIGTDGSTMQSKWGSGEDAGSDALRSMKGATYQKFSFAAL